MILKIHKRTVFKSILFAFLLLGGAVLLSPYWLPLVGKPLAARYNLQWESISPQDWSTWTLRNVRYSTERVTLSIDELSLPQPFPWLGQGLLEGPRTLLSAGEVVIETRKRETEDVERKESAGFALLDDIRQEVLDGLPWTPKATVRRLVVGDEGTPDRIILENLVLDGPRLAGEISGISHLPVLALELEFLPDQLQLKAVPLGRGDIALQLAIQPAREASQVEGQVLSRGVPLNIALDFPPGRWSPRAIRAEAQDWPLPDDFSAWTVWEDRDIVGDIRFEMVERSYSASLNLSGWAGFPGTEMEPVEADFRLSGDRIYLHVEDCRITTPWLQASLSEPISYSLVSGHFLKDGRFTLTADLDRQALFQAKGQLRAEASVQTRTGADPELQFEIAGESLEFLGYSIPSVQMQGTYEVPDLALRNAVIDLGLESSLVASGRFNLREATLDASGNFTLSPAWLAPWSGNVSVSDSLRGTLAAKGPLAFLEHEGNWQPVLIQVEGLHPVKVSGSWRGKGLEELALETDMESAEAASASAAMIIRPRQSGPGWTVSVEALRLADPAHQLELEEPFAIELEQEEKLALSRVTPFMLRQGEQSLGGRFERESGVIAIDGRNIDLASLRYWITAPVAPVFLDTVHLHVSGLSPFLDSRFTLQAHASDPSYEDLKVELTGRTGKDGILLETIEGRVGQIPFIEGSLSAPIRIAPRDPQSRIQPIPGKSIEGTLAAQITGEIAGRLPPIPYVQSLQGLRINVTAEGTPDSPVAGLELALDRLNVFDHLGPEYEAYAFRNLELSARVTPESSSVESFRAGWKDARFSSTGNFSTPDLVSFISAPGDNLEKLLQSSAFHIALQGFQAKSVEALLPPYLRPAGTIEGDFYNDQAQFKGQVRVKDFSLRPTPFFPTVDGIHLNLDLDDSRMTISEAGATVGNSRVGLSGFVDLADFRNPAYRVSIKGQRTPLLRTPDLLLHGDIDLVLDSTAPSRPAKLSGNIRLRDSVMLMEIDPMAARTAGQELPKPPFFNITRDPFAEWILDVDISGEDFLRFRSPYAKALVSVQMDLTGTAANPIWVGEVFTTEGTVDFPGLRMAISRSDIFITRERQDTLQLDINAIGQVASYVVSLRVEETIDEPHVEFATTPNLSNTQILHLLATGSTEGSNFSSVGLYLGRGLFDPGANNSLWDRLSIEIGRDISETSKDTLDLFYDITDRWRLHGQYDKYDAQNLNIEWEAFSR